MSDSLGGLPEYRARVQQRVVGPPGMVSVGDGGASGLFALSRSAGQVSALFEQQADQYFVDRATEQGRNLAIDRDPATGLPVAPQLRQDGTPAGRAFDAAARVAYLDTWKQDVTTAAIREAANHRNTPEAFLERMRQRIATMTENAPPEFRQELAREATGVAEGIGRQLLTGWANTQYQQAGQAWEQQVGTYAETARLLARQGVAVDSPQMREALTRYEEQLNRGVIAGHISPEQARLRMEQGSAEVLVAQIAGEFGRRAESQGVEAARRWANDALNDPRLAPAGDRVLAWARSQISAEAGDYRIARTEQRQQVASDWRTMEANARAGVNVPVDQFEGIARRAEAANLPDVAAEARAFAQVAPQVSTLSRAPLPELIQAQVEAQAGNPNDPATGMLLRSTNHMINARMEALRSDPAGYAAQHPTVQAARRRAAADR